ncbi:AAA family ATPase [Eggerthellaceae bacterium zg-893]|nr:AAA family ATPase [Eggerthellaceae bacterium zg-893]
MSRRYLSFIKMDRFGAFNERVIGPFGPGLNVVYGKNEAGKTTTASFVGGVLFGWEEARGNRNTYKPEGAERSGTLVFSDKDCPDDDVRLSRVRNADGLQGDATLVQDVDKNTYQTMFSLTSDELRSLRKSSEVTAKLLTAGSGTGSSPAAALQEIQQRLASYTSKAAGASHSFENLRARKEQLREQIHVAAAEAERFKNDEAELAELAPQRSSLLERIEALNGLIEQLSATVSQLEKLEAEKVSLDEKIARLRRDEGEVRTSLSRAGSRVPAHLSTEAQERSTLDAIEALAAEEVKLAHSEDLARENYVTSKAVYEALLETTDDRQSIADARHKRRTQLVLSIGVPLVSLIAGIMLFVHGRSINSLSFTALGVGLAFAALMLAGAALIMLFRPDKVEEEREQRKQDALWVMVQDKKKYEGCQNATRSFEQRKNDLLAEVGLDQAQGSLRRARMLIEEAREARSDRDATKLRQQALMSRRHALQERRDAAEEQRRALCERAGLDGEATAAEVEALMAGRIRQRKSLLEASERVNSRHGELQAELAAARSLTKLDALKLEYEQVATRIERSSRDYARLLLARSMLEGAIGAWESVSQPEVYREASRLLSLMTKGRWTKIDMGPDGKLEVTARDLAVTGPERLSLATCQQVYLALRIALLMTATNVGRSIPVLADDILVNFDAPRRAGAAAALAELSQVRQVIVFTCHKEVVRALRNAAADLTEVPLG